MAYNKTDRADAPMKEGRNIRRRKSASIVLIKRL